MKVLPDTMILSPLFCYSRKRLFEEICEQASTELKVEPQILIDALNTRETEGSTVFFTGIAIPHALIKKIGKSKGILSILDKPIPFNSIDSDPQYIDIAYTLFVSPEEDYEEIERLLRDVTATLANQDLLNSLRLSRNEPTKIHLIIEKIDQLLDENRKSSTQNT
ncbi:MAG: PTS sugar transporter subunit IIA [Succinivibrio sp.]|nr:PTS sugar transporter subunit IIA [Succinivibrio sp.]